MNKLLVILGPTATGKSDLAVKLAKKYNGEVISSDSRQVYKGLDIGTGKITKKERRGVPHHMLDIVSPKKSFTVAEYQKIAEKNITDILSREKLPILCGGTGFYIQSIVDGLVLPEVPPNKILRKKLEKKSLGKLVKILKKLDPERASDIDKKNPVRLIRSIEIATALGKVPKLKKEKSEYDILQIGLTLPLETLKQKIHTRLISRIKIGMIKEAEKLHREELSWKRMNELGLEYRYLAEYLQKKISKQELLDKLNVKIQRYAKRQITWFKRDGRIHWFSPKQLKQIDKTVKGFVD